jgi:hypothetical protein
VTVLHPEQPGWAVSGVSPAQDLDTGRPEGERVHRFKLPARTGTLRVEEERSRTEIWQISDLPRERLVSLLTDRVREDLSRVAEERDRAVSDQERARRMMGSAPSGSDMQGRFRTSVLELEDRIGELDAREAELTLELRAAEAALDALLAE